MTATGTRWIAYCVGLAAGVCLFLTHPLHAQGLPPKVIVWQNPATASIGHYAILGEVARPGTYGSSEEMTLQRLVAAAGGLSAQALPAVRIIRTERAGQSLYFNPSGHDRLNAGDFVVVDRNSLPAMNGEPLRSEPIVWIGIAGVSQRPVVVPVEPGDAHLPTIMLALGQSQELARSARVMLPPGSPPLLANQAQMLPNGTIIALPPGLLVWGRLPDFPESQAIPDAGTQPSPRFAQVTNPATAPVPVPPLTEPAATVGAEPYHTPFDQELSASTLPFSSVPVQDTAASPASLPAPGSRLAPTQNVAPPPPTVAGPVPVTANLTANMEQQLTSDADIVGEMSPPPKQSTFNVWQMLGIAGTVASLVGVALGTRQYLDRATTSQAVQPLPRNSSRISPEMFAAAAERVVSRRAVEPELPREQYPARELPPTPQPIKAPPVQRESLSDLLQRKTPIEQELADLPLVSQLPLTSQVSGRTAKSETIYGVDAPHAGPASAPHLPEAQLTPIDLKLEVDPPREPVLPRPHFALKPSSNPIASEVAIPMAIISEGGAATDTAASTATLPDDPRFQSPIERALARLQRGRRA